MIAAVLWPGLLGGAVRARQHGDTPMWTAVVYAATSRICHQRPERSFFTGHVQWPVCARCSGLYLGAPAGALAAALLRRRSRRTWSAPRVVGLAAVPTLASLAVEWLHLVAVSNIERGIAAVPLGVAIAAVLVAVATPPPESNRGTLNRDG